MTSKNRLKDEEGLFNELDALFSDKEDLLDIDFYTLPEFREAVIDIVLDHIENAESEWKHWQPLRGLS